MVEVPRQGDLRAAFGFSVFGPAPLRWSPELSPTVKECGRREIWTTPANHSRSGRFRSGADGRTTGCARLGDVLVGRMGAPSGCRAGLGGDAYYVLVLGSLGDRPVEHL